MKAGVVRNVWDYRWSSVHAHLAGHDRNGLVKADRLLSLVGDWKTYLQSAQGDTSEVIEKHERTGRPLGSDDFVEKAGLILHRDLKKQKPGPKRKDN